MCVPTGPNPRYQVQEWWPYSLGTSQSAGAGRQRGLAQRGKEAAMRSHSTAATETGLEPDSPDSGDKPRHSGQTPSHPSLGVTQATLEALSGRPCPVQLGPTGDREDCPPASSTQGHRAQMADCQSARAPCGDTGDPLTCPLPGCLRGH
jgi:hypothetical protein